MANVTYVSDNLPAFVLEAAQRLRSAELALTPAQNNLSISYGDSLATITGTLPVVNAVVAGTAGISALVSDYTPLVDPVLTDTVLSDVTVDNAAETLFAAVVRLDAAESVKLANNQPLPEGAGTTYSISEGGATFSAIIPISYAVATDGSITVATSNYVA